MELIVAGAAEAVRLIATGDAEVIGISLLSLRVAGTSTLLSLGLGLPLGILIAFRRLPGWRLWLAAVNAGMGLPPVVAGLFVTLLLWRSGPLGELRLLFTPTAMVIAQVLIALPVIAGLTYSALRGLDPSLYEVALLEGAGTLRAGWLLLLQARPALLAAVIAGFGAVISEVGASMMVGGNIRGQTRVLTTATVFEASRGEFPIAIALSIILLGIILALNAVLTYVQQRD
jgi:tungstate transport system permease protein